MSTPLTPGYILNMSDDELKETNKKLTKALITRIAVGVVTTVTIHFATTALINKLEGDNESENDN